MGGDDFGLVYGEKRNRNGCSGLMVEIDEGTCCSCHINPPCSHCVDKRFECDGCGYETETPYKLGFGSYGMIKLGKPAPLKRESAEEQFDKLRDNEFGYVSICGNYYWMEAKGKYSEDMAPEDILGKFNTCFGYQWLRSPRDGVFHLKYYTD